eukprot:s2915_g4.t1
MADEVLAPCAAAPTMPAVAAANAKHMAYIHECVTSDPVAGKYVPVNWKSVQPASGAGNFFWVDLALDPAIAHTAIKTRKCSEIAEHYYNVPKPLISDVVVGVAQSFCHGRHQIVPAPAFLRNRSTRSSSRSTVMS